MFEAKITAILNEASLALPYMAMERSLAGAWAAHLRTALPQARSLLLVMDANTKTALGAQVATELAQDFSVTPCVLEGTPLPDEISITRITADARQADALIAIGSGTLNDLCKITSHRLAKPYAVLPTAPSMNGYTSANASIITQGIKHSVPAHLPRAVLCDLGVLATSPARLKRAGIGDSLARATAQADWLLSHHLLGTPYETRAFALVAEAENSLLPQVKQVMAGEPDAIAALMRVLLLSGLGMTLCGGSHPASQAEHMLAHLMEMLGSPPGLHGEEIGVTTVFMARIQEALLLQNGTELKNPAFPKAEIKNALGKTAMQAFHAEYMAKSKSLKKLQKSKELQTRWQHARAAIAPIHLPASRIVEILHSIDAPVVPGQLGWATENFVQAVKLARFTRNRFTFLDIG